MSKSGSPRRQFFKTSVGAVVAGLSAPYVFTADAAEAGKPKSKNDRLRIGSIGMRYQGSVIACKAQAHGDIVAIADIDRHVRDQAKASFGSTAKTYEDYRQLLDRKDIDVVTIGTPDHWHAKMVIDACRAGKDVYVEKPLTLTVDEGKLIRNVARQTGRVVQVGSWQRNDCRFRLAVAMVRRGDIGKLQKVEVVLGKNLRGGPFELSKPPKNINWDMWQGQTPSVPYIEERCHFTFRWWYEYSGGQMTDWGAHHLDIAQWGIDSYPVEIDTNATFPEVPNGYNVALDFSARYKYANGVEMTVADEGRNGVMFIGTEGRIFVNRGTVAGKPVEELAAEVGVPVDQVAFQPRVRQKYGNILDSENFDRPPRAGKLDAIVNHMGNFFDCVASRNAPASDVECQHRSATTCHLGNISMRLGRRLQWDPAKELFVADPDANAWLKREQRKPYQIEA